MNENETTEAIDEPLQDAPRKDVAARDLYHEDYMTHQRRNEALALSVKSFSTGSEPTDDMLVRRAQAFEKFLEGRNDG